PGFALEQQRLPEREREEDGGPEPAIGEIRLVAEAGRDLLDGLRPRGAAVAGWAHCISLAYGSGPRRGEVLLECRGVGARGAARGGRAARAAFSATWRFWRGWCGKCIRTMSRGGSGPPPCTSSRPSFIVARHITTARMPHRRATIGTDWL